MKILLLTASDIQPMYRCIPALTRRLQRAGHAVTLAQTTVEARQEASRHDIILYPTVQSVACALKPNELALMEANNPQVRVVVYTSDTKRVPVEEVPWLEVVYKDPITGLQDLLAVIAQTPSA